MRSILLLLKWNRLHFFKKSRNNMTNKELEELVKCVSLKYFNKPFKHQAYFNSRLRTTGGRYHLHSHDLDFNPKIVEIFGRDILVGIIKHELCHYHLHLADKGYRHGDTDFKELLNQVGGLRYTPSIEGEKGIYVRWAYQCQACNKVYHRKRRFNVRKFVCGQCKGQLVLQGKDRLKNN